MDDVQDIEALVLGRESVFHMNAKELDRRRWRPYWALPHELFARVFEQFAHDRLTSQGEHNDYLVTLYRHEIPPYPDENEMNVFKPMLDEIVQKYL